MTTKDYYISPECELKLVLDTAVICTSGQLDPIEEWNGTITWN